jgi:hypothetical protein
VRGPAGRTASMGAMTLTIALGIVFVVWDS